MTSSLEVGFVTVLSSQKSRMDALKIFANMQEKYGEVLASHTPDVLRWTSMKREYGTASSLDRLVAREPLQQTFVANSGPLALLGAG